MRKGGSATNSPVGRKKNAVSDDGTSSPSALKKNPSLEDAVGGGTEGGAPKSPSLKRRSSFVKLSSMLRKLGGSGSEDKQATTAVPSAASGAGLLFKRSSSGSLRADERASSPDSLVSPRSHREVVKAPPVCSAFEAHLATNFPVLLAVSQVVVEAASLDDETRVGLFATLVELLKMHEHLVRFVSFIANGEAKKCSDPNTLFRETGVLVMLCRALCTSAASCAYLEPLVARICAVVDAAGGGNLDIDASRVSPQVAEANAARLAATVDKVLECAAASLSDCPPLLRLFFQTVFSIVNVRHAGFGFRSLANFYFLRFLVPALMAPLADSARSPVDRAAIVNVAKTVQCIANCSLPEGSLSLLASYVQGKTDHVEEFFVNLITARPDDSVSELQALEFPQGEFDRLRGALHGWLLGELHAVRARLGGVAQLHPWIGDDAEMHKTMQELVTLGKDSSGMLSPPRGTWKR